MTHLPREMGLARRSATWAALLTALSVSTLAGTALANGRYPAAGQIVLSPNTPSTLIVRTTYGILISTNAGKDWAWICEPAVGYNSDEDPAMAFTADGTILAGLFEGLSIGSPDACYWSFAQGGLAGRYVIDVDVDEVNPAHGVIINSINVATDDAGSSIFPTQVWQTADSGATWTQAGVNLPQSFLGLTIATAPSNQQRVYVSGREGPPDYLGVLQRSDDRGMTWQELPVPGSGPASLPYVGAVDPHDPDIVYVRLASDPGDTLLVSKDGGMTYATIYSAIGNLLGFALSPDGSMVATGGTRDGVLTAPASTLDFTSVSSVGVLCLTWAAAGLYACADEFTDHFTAGISTDQGRTFTPLMHLGGLCGPVACGLDSGVTNLCPAYWPSTETTIDNQGCDAGAGSPSSSTSGGAGSSSHGSSSSGPGTSEGGCSCAVPQEVGGGAALALAGVAAAIARRSRRRR